MCLPLSKSVYFFPASIIGRFIAHHPVSKKTRQCPYPPRTRRFEAGNVGRGKLSYLPFVNRLELLAEDGVIGDSTGMANAANLCGFVGSNMKGGRSHPDTPPETALRDRFLPPPSCPFAVFSLFPLRSRFLVPRQRVTRVKYCAETKKKCDE